MKNRDPTTTQSSGTTNTSGPRTRGITALETTNQHEKQRKSKMNERGGGGVQHILNHILHLMWVVRQHHYSIGAKIPLSFI